MRASRAGNTEYLDVACGLSVCQVRDSPGRGPSAELGLVSSGMVVFAMGGLEGLDLTSPGVGSLAPREAAAAVMIA